MGLTYNFFEYFIFFYASSMFIVYLVLGVLSFINITRYRTYNSRIDDQFLIDSPLTPGISVVAPAYNEEKTIIVNVKSLLTLNYPLYEVIIVNDGSKDKTLELLIDEFELEETPYAYVERIKTKPFKRIFKSVNPKYSMLTVVDKMNGGTKADASNAGINASQYDYFLCTDVDCLLERNTLLRMIKPVLNSKDRVIAVGATLRMSNSCEIKDGIIERVKPPNKLIPRFQELEYLRAYLFGKMGWSLVNAVPNVSGGLGLFDKEVAVNAGGYDGESHAEDMDMVSKMAAYMINNHQKYRIEYIPVSCCWTEGPPNIKILSRQRIRWATGMAQIFFVHRKILLNPRYKKMGMITFPFQLIYEFLAPVIEFIGIIYFIFLILKGDVNWSMAGYIFLYSYSLAIMFGTLVILLDNFVKRQYKTSRETFKLWLMVFLEPFIYHPLLIYFSLKGYFNFYTSKKMEWGTMTRQGYENTGTSKKINTEDSTNA
ncbi:glycosyltransferase family 2 protein [Flavobacterium arcticum]|uniref:Glycosyltransferase family 2 protein n=2 Tax=Flavobacterium arcticum TaxID=1784713 RepID=A0A345HCU1_9FLAO|nr:glycosyltransferase [Flavobacterium arcticum]AXG74401.1 glycosyltransferase family 2 protein [Flavobacterium arcticum]KAF2512479.1 glycosyltransferase family 2 protein [Flavobacterium arcticum]